MADVHSSLARVGVEIELLAPPGLSRWDLAFAIAGRGEIRRRFHLDSEPSLVPGTPTFMHLSRAWDVVSLAGTRCSLVDDITIAVTDAGPQSSEPEDYRILSDESRLLRLIARHADPEAEAHEVLDPIGELYGTNPMPLANGLFRLNDGDGASIAIAAPQQPGRSRVCEIVTSVLDSRDGDLGDQLTPLLKPAQDLGFMVPVEAAVHVHFDAEPFRDVGRLRRLVDLFWHKREELWGAFNTNEHCRRLGPAPEALIDLVAVADGYNWQWPKLEAELATLGLSKFQDLNIRNLVGRTPGKDTVEVRILGPSIDPGRIGNMVADLTTRLGDIW